MIQALVAKGRRLPIHVLLAERWFGRLQDCARHCGSVVLAQTKKDAFNVIHVVDSHGDFCVSFIVAVKHARLKFVSAMLCASICLQGSTHTRAAAGGPKLPDTHDSCIGHASCYLWDGGCSIHHLPFGTEAL